MACMYLTCVWHDFSGFRNFEGLPPCPPVPRIQPRDRNCRLVFLQRHCVGFDPRRGQAVREVAKSWELVSLIPLRPRADFVWFSYSDTNFVFRGEPDIWSDVGCSIYNWDTHMKILFYFIYEKEPDMCDNYYRYMWRNNFYMCNFFLMLNK